MNVYKIITRVILSILSVIILSSCGFIVETNFITARNAGWWDDNWSNRRKLTFDNSGQSENIQNFPILIKIDSTRIDYSKTQNTGQDVRFIDPDDTELKYEIEKWDESGESFIWVKVPQVDASSSTDYIWMYYGNAGAADNQDPVNVWDANYIGVWHLSESSGTLYDSTVNTNNGTPEGTITYIDSGAVDGAQDFDAGTDRVNIGLNLGATVTISAWAKLDTQGDMLWCIDTTGGPDLWFEANNIHLNSWDGAVPANLFCPQPANVNQWHHYSTVISPGNTVLYIDGLFGGTTTYKDPTETIIYIGSSDTTYTWDGSVDELRISSIVRSADWTKAQYDSMSDVFVTFGNEE